jgi:hypothetical protein
MRQSLTGQVRNNRSAGHSHAGWHHQDQEWSLPVTVSLPASVVVSLIMWVALAFAAKSLFF